MRTKKTYLCLAFCLAFYLFPQHQSVLAETQYWRQDPHSDVFASANSPAYRYGMRSVLDRVDRLYRSDLSDGRDASKAHHRAARSFTEYLIRASASYMATNSAARCSAVSFALYHAVRAFEASVRKRPDGLYFGIAGIGESDIKPPRTSFFGLDVSSNSQENMMTLAWTIHQHDNCNDFEDRVLELSLCTYARYNALLRSGNNVLRRTDNVLTLRDNHGSFELSPRKTTRSSVSAEDLAQLCLPFMRSSDYSFEIGHFLLLLEAGKTEVATELAAGSSFSDLASAMIEGWRPE